MCSPRDSLRWKSGDTLPISRAEIWGHLTYFQSSGVQCTPYPTLIGGPRPTLHKLLSRCSPSATLRACPELVEGGEIRGHGEIRGQVLIILRKSLGSALMK